MSDGILRKLTTNDIPAAEELSVEAGWNQTSDDWRMLLELSPQGCLAIELDGKLASTTTLLRYGTRLAWIGMVLTKISFQGRGFARLLLTHALALADEMAIETLKLDATDQGQPLYEKLGFRREQEVERWTRPASANAPLSTPSEIFAREDWRSADHRASGVDRSELLNSLARRRPPLSTGCSYLLARSGRLTEYLGPCVANSPKTARDLMECALQTSTHGWSWDLLPKNRNALALARDLGFTQQRHLTRMVRGKDLRAEENLIYAIAGFELG
jgi:ribosomal protein S18 acetylase RimI-like enzyme